MRVQPLTWRNSWRFLGSAGQTFASGQSRGDAILIKILCVDVWEKMFPRSLEFSRLGFGVLKFFFSICIFKESDPVNEPK